MAKINIIIADDKEEIHESLRDTLDSINFDYNIIKDCYDIMGVLRYLYSMGKDENTEYADVLILDHDFGGSGKRGLDSLPDIRKICPMLPILMLTTYDGDEEFVVARKKYNIDYIQKPAKATDLRWRIMSIIDQMDNWDLLSATIKENEEMQAAMKEKENVKVLPKDILNLIQNIFPDVDFLPKAFRLLSNTHDTKKDWNRMFRCLKVIDWKNEMNAPAGTKVQKYKDGGNNTWEYRFSQAGRIFVQRRENEKPLVLLIDPTHSYSDMPALY